MKILHTSDLHLGKRWHGISLLDDQDRVLDEILALCDEHEVDMLLVAGDVFSDHVDGNKPANVAWHLLQKLRQPLERGRAVFLLRGNHDPFELFGLMNLMMTEMAGKDGLPLIIANQPGVYPAPGYSFQVIALPYLSPSWLRTQPFTLDTTPDEQVAQLSGLLSHQLRQLFARIPSGVPTIFAGHVQVTGANIRPDMEFESRYNRDLWLHPRDLPQFTSYNALGHIHLGQEIKGVGKPSWYAGAPDRLDLGERDYHPHVLLVTTPETPGGTATVVPLPLQTCTKWIFEELHGVDDVDRFCRSLDGPCIGDVKIFDIPAPYRGDLETRIHDAVPRIRIQWMGQAVAVEAIGGEEEGPSPQDVHGTVWTFLRRAFAQDPDRFMRLEEAFEALWSETSEVAV